MRALKGISAVALAASLVLAAGTGVAAGATPDKEASALLAGGLKQAMQKKLKTVQGLKMTKVTCNVPKTAKTLAGKCTARFTVARVNLNGVYRVRASMNGNGLLTYSTTSLKCTDAKSNQTIPC